MYVTNEAVFRINRSRLTSSRYYDMEEMNAHPS